MKTFTVIGYWEDSLQRFTTYVTAGRPDEAEEICMREYPGVTVCAVLRGRQQCLDTTSHVRAAAD